MHMHFSSEHENQHAALSCSPHNVIVAIPTLNEANSIAHCLTSLRSSDPFMKEVDIVVADGGSNDGTQEIVRRLSEQDPKLTLIHNPSRFQSAGVNHAVKLGARPRHEILVRCDAHAIYPPGYVRSVVEAFAEHPDAASVTTVMDATGSSGFQRACAWVVDTPLGSGGAAHRGGSLSTWVDHGHHAGFKLDWFRRLGGYDEAFSHNEDAEYDCRLARAGGRIWLDAKIRLAYKMRSDPMALMRQYWNYGRGRARTVLKHRSCPRLRQLVPAANFLGMTVCALLSVFWPILLVWPASYAILLGAVSLVAVRSLRDLSGAWAGPALAIMHNAWGAGFLRQILFPAAERTGTEEPTVRPIISTGYVYRTRETREIMAKAAPRQETAGADRRARHD